MSVLDDFADLSTYERHLRLRQRDTQEALDAMGTDAAFAWLEEHIQSPIGPEWANAFGRLRPSWKRIERWIRLSKLHCLAAVDVLLGYTPSPYYDDDKEIQLPPGANAVLINDAITFALEHYGNPRLEDAAKRIRHAWPVGKPTRHTVSIPKPLRQFAATLFGNDSALMKEWNESLATAMNAPENADDIWHSLLEFADRKDVVAIVDWREFSESIIEKLRHLSSANGLPIAWQAYSDYDGENDNLFRDIGTEITGSARSLVSLDTGGDSYALTFLRSDAIPELESLIASALDDPQTIQRFD